MQFDRWIRLIGTENFEKVKNLIVVIVGVGGVGGYVVESLARSGVETLIVIDPDTVDETNINRQLIALHSSINKYKVELFQERIKDISKECNCIPIKEKITSENLDLLTKYHPDFIVDACDDITAKKLIIKEAVQNHIPFISSMGTGKRLDPSKLLITTLDKTEYDPIAKILRKFVRNEKITEKITVLASKEIPVHSESKEITSCSFVPASAGLLIASFIINSVLEKR